MPATVLESPAFAAYRIKSSRYYDERNYSENPFTTQKIIFNPQDESMPDFGGLRECCRFPQSALDNDRHAIGDRRTPHCLSVGSRHLRVQRILAVARGFAGDLKFWKRQ